MYTFNLNGQQLSIPNQLGELTYADFLNFIKCKTDLEKLELLSGAELKNLPSSCEKQMANVLRLLDKFEQSINDYLQGRKNSETSTEVKVFDNVVKFGENLGVLPYWPFTKVKAIVKKMGSEPFNEYEHYTGLVGHYIYAKINEYDEYKAEAFSEEYVSAMPFTHVIRLGDFFLFMQHRLWMPKLSYYKAKLLLMKRKLALKILPSMAS